MSGTDEPERDDEPRPPDSEAGAPATESPEKPQPEPDDGAGQAATPTEQDGLAEDPMAAGVFADEPGDSDHLASEDLRSPSVGAGKPIRTRELGNTDEYKNRTGIKLATDHAMAIENLVYNVTGASTNQASGGQVRATVIESIVDTHVATTDHDLLRDTLLRYGVANLSGAEGSGRTDTAYAVLAELCGHDKIVAIDLNDDVDLAEVLKQKDLLRAGHGHVVELPAHRPAPRKQTLDTVGGQFEAKHIYLVVVGPPGPADDTLHPYEVRHQPPAPADVLDRHLPHQLGLRTNWSAEQVATFVATCRTSPGIAERLYSSWQPGEIVRLVRRLVDVGLRGGQPDEALELLPGALRELAVTVLRDANEDEDTLRRLTARITYGLFGGRPLTVVFELASLLFETVSPEDKATSAKSPRLVQTVFGGMESLIDERMRATSHGDDTDGARLARLVDSELTLAVLDVVWHDFDHLRAPLLKWLYELGGDPRQQVYTRAGRLAGELMLYDFVNAYRELIRPWARSANWAHRQSAALAMEHTVLEPKLTARVCRQVRDWTYSPSPYLNNTAAWCFATRLAEFADEPLVHLWLVALGSEQILSPAVATAVARLHEPDDPESGLAILTELARWTGDRTRSLHVHAARAVTFLARRAASSPHERWPALLRQASADPLARDLLLGLWQAALTEPMVAAQGWQALLTWLLKPAELDELHEFTVAFATDLLRIPVLRARAGFHLSQWLLRHPDAPVLRRLRDNL